MAKLIEDFLKVEEFEDDGREKVTSEELIGQVFEIEDAFEREGDDGPYVTLHIKMGANQYYWNTGSKVIMSQISELLDEGVFDDGETVKAKLIQRKSKKSRKKYYVLVNPNRE